MVQEVDVDLTSYDGVYSRVTKPHLLRTFSAAHTDIMNTLTKPSARVAAYVTPTGVVKFKLPKNVIESLVYDAVQNPQSVIDSHGLTAEEAMKGLTHLGPDGGLSFIDAYKTDDQEWHAVFRDASGDKQFDANMDDLSILNDMPAAKLWVEFKLEKKQIAAAVLDIVVKESGNPQPVTALPKFEYE